MTNKIVCAICEEIVDRGACNQNFTIITTVKDTDEAGTKKIRNHLCDTHTAHLELWISTEAYKFATAERFDNLLKREA